MTAARRATAAWRPRGLSWRRSSSVRSCTRARLACIASSLRSAFSLRLRCLRTPAASSMKARRPMGSACRTESSWPWPTMTCISRPMPESDRSSWMSSRRQVSPLIWYSLPPLRNMVRVMVTSAYSMGSAPSELSMVRDTSARPSGGAAGGAGEDDVLHLAAAQRLGALFAHDPVERVHDIGLARAVRADDTRDARFEPECGCRGERLEPTEGQGLEVHAGGLYPPPLSHSMNPRSRAVSPVTMQGTPDVEEGERMRGGNNGPDGERTAGERTKGRRSVLATLTTGSQPSDQLSG